MPYFCIIIAYLYGMEIKTGLKTQKFGEIYSYEYIQQLRELDRKKPNPRKIIAQAGAQERMLQQDVDVLICGGNRGGSKSFSLLLQALKDIRNPKLKVLLVRNEKPDLDGLIKDSDMVYKQYGQYNRSINDMTWNFNAGGSLKFSYYGDDYTKFKKRFQGKQYAYIGIDEICQCPYGKFKYLLTVNRNAFGIRNRFWGTCNPDPDSWVRKFIDWWIDPDTGYPIPERDGTVRYCFMDGDSVDTIYWGDTPHEVYLKCQHIIDKLWNEEYEVLGYDKERMFVKSVTFVRATVTENIKLISSDPSYVANLAQQGDEQRERDLGGNWNYKAAGDDMITIEDMEMFFTNPEQGGGRRFASCDVAFQGGDNLVLWLVEENKLNTGWHVKDIFVCRYDSKAVIATVSAKLMEWGVPEENFTYDLNGLGQAFRGFFPKAVPFNNCGAPIAKSRREEEGIKYLYHDLKSQAAYMFYNALKEKRMSIDKNILDNIYSGNGFNKLRLKEILLRERKAIRRKDPDSDKGFWIMVKADAKKLVGHSPDFIESLYYVFIFFIQRTHKKAIGLWMI